MDLSVDDIYERKGEKKLDRKFIRLKFLNGDDIFVKSERLLKESVMLSGMMENGDDVADISIPVACSKSVVRRIDWFLNEDGKDMEYDFIGRKTMKNYNKRTFLLECYPDDDFENSELMGLYRVINFLGLYSRLVYKKKYEQRGALDLSGFLLESFLVLLDIRFDEIRLRRDSDEKESDIYKDEKLLVEIVDKLSMKDLATFGEYRDLSRINEKYTVKSFNWGLSGGFGPPSRYARILYIYNNLYIDHKSLLKIPHEYYMVEMEIFDKYNIRYPIFGGLASLRYRIIISESTYGLEDVVSLGELPETWQTLEIYNSNEDTIIFEHVEDGVIITSNTDMMGFWDGLIVDLGGLLIKNYTCSTTNDESMFINHGGVDKVVFNLPFITFCFDSKKVHPIIYESNHLHLNGNPTMPKYLRDFIESKNIKITGDYKIRRKPKYISRS